MVESVNPPGETSADARGRMVAVIENGITAGIIGGAVVAVWFLILDVARGQPFFTPSLIGSVLFLGSEAAEVTTINPMIVFAYTGLHGVLFLVAGIALAWMFSVFDRNPQFGIVLLLLFLLFESVLFGFEVTIVPSLVGTLGALVVGLANVFSALAMFWFLLRRHPGTMSKLRESWNE